MMLRVTYGFSENGFGSGVSDAIDVLEREFNSLLIGNFYSTDTSSLNFKRHPSEGSLHTRSSSRSLYRCPCSKAFIALESLHDGK